MCVWAVWRRAKSQAYSYCPEIDRSRSCSLRKLNLQCKYNWLSWIWWRRTDFCDKYLPLQIVWSLNEYFLNYLLYFSYACSSEISIQWLLRLVKLPANCVTGHLCSRCSIVCGCWLQWLQVGVCLFPHLCRVCVVLQRPLLSWFIKTHSPRDSVGISSLEWSWWSGTLTVHRHIKGHFVP